MKIALLTPYTGGNLGDAAIQEAVIANLKQRFPDASLYLVSVLPGLTAPLHGVPSFPIGRFGQWQDGRVATTSSEEEADSSSAPPVSGRSWRRRIKARLKSSRAIYSVLKPLQRRLWPIYDEALHIHRAYEFLQDVDLVIVSGGGQLDEYWGGPWDHPYALFKWGLLARQAGVPFVVLSVGTCEIKSKLSVFFIRNALRLASYRSYRDRVSKDLLADLALTREDRVYPDLAFSYSNEEIGKASPEVGAGKVVGVSPIAYLAKSGWPDQDEAVHNPYFEALLFLVQTLLKRGYSVVLFSSDGPDREIVNEMVEALAEREGFEGIDRLRDPSTATLPELMGQLATLDYVVASRLHGVLLSHRFFLPVLAVSYDRKVDTYMADVGLSEYCVDIRSVDGESLLQAFDRMTESAASIRSALFQVNQRYARDLQQQYDAVLGQYEKRDAP